MVVVSTDSHMQPGVFVGPAHVSTYNKKVNTEIIVAFISTLKTANWIVLIHTTTA
jgi:hypothetical protein